ncbi:hypothetical protein MTO96_044116 [Rhipicephalus appendiculatus]
MILGTQLRLLVKVREPVDEGSSPDLLDTKFVQVGQISFFFWCFNRGLWVTTPTRELSLTNAHSTPVSLPPWRWGELGRTRRRSVRGPPFLFGCSAGAEMEVVSVEGEDKRPEEFGKESGWCEVRRGAKTLVGGETGSAGNKQRGRSFVEDAPKSKWNNEQNVRKIIKASRLPNLPGEDYRVIVRPHGGLNVSEYRMDRIHCCQRNAAGVSRETAQEDSMCINNTPNILVISTPSEVRARRYEAITKLRIGEQEFGTSAYRAAPKNTSKGLIQGCPRRRALTTS